MYKEKKDIRKKRKKRKETERQKRSRGRERRYEKRYCETRKVSFGQFLGTVTQANKAKDEAASLRGELRLARSEQADRSIFLCF